MLEYDRLKEIVASVEEDMIKVEKGNKAAGTRVRKVMQEVKAAAQALRVKVLELKSGADLPPAPGADRCRA